MRILAIDPTGKGSGGAVLRDGKQTIGFAAWTLIESGWRLRRGAKLDGDWEDVAIYADLGQIGERLYASFPTFKVLVVEGLEPPKDPKRRTLKSTRDLITLAEGLGQTLGPLVRYAGGNVLRPTAEEWRAVMGHSKSSGRDAENAAIAAARREGWLPRWSAEEQGAVAEARGMAVWADREAF